MHSPEFSQNTSPPDCRASYSCWVALGCAALIEMYDLVENCSLRKRSACPSGSMMTGNLCF